MSEGQHISKAFSERILVQKTVRDLESLPDAAGRVVAVIHADMLTG